MCSMGTDSEYLWYTLYFGTCAQTHLYKRSFLVIQRYYLWIWSWVNWKKLFVALLFYLLAHYAMYCNKYDTGWRLRKKLPIATSRVEARVKTAYFTIEKFEKKERVVRVTRRYKHKRLLHLTLDSFEGIDSLV